MLETQLPWMQMWLRSGTKCFGLRSCFKWNGLYIVHLLGHILHNNHYSTFILHTLILTAVVLLKVLMKTRTSLWYIRLSSILFLPTKENKVFIIRQCGQKFDFYHADKEQKFQCLSYFSSTSGFARRMRHEQPTWKCKSLGWNTFGKDGMALTAQDSKQYRVTKRNPPSDWK